MRMIHKTAAASALAIGLLVPAAGLAGATEPNHGTATSAAAKAKAKTTNGTTTSAAAKAKTTHGSTTSAAAKAKAKKAKKLKARIVHAGTVTAVTPTSITFTVHGGRDKALRGKSVTFAVTATTKVTRNDAVGAIASVKVGDHANVKGTKAGTVYTAVRVSASGL